MKVYPFKALVKAFHSGEHSRKAYVSRARVLLSQNPPRKLLAKGDSNAKLAKGKGFRVYSLSLVPFTILGIFNFCAYASPACANACLFTAGRGIMRNVSEGRIRKALFFVLMRDRFLSILEREIRGIVNRFGESLAFRLNVLSDIPWEKFPGIRAIMEDDTGRIVFYDYTKSLSRMLFYLSGENWPRAYHLTFSFSGENERDCLKVLAKGGNVAIPFLVGSPAEFPSRFWGYPVVSGEDSDFRFLDPFPCVVALTAKGKAKQGAGDFTIEKGDSRGEWKA